MSDAITFLQTRRSVKPMEPLAPGPNAEEIKTLLTIATRVPDHGKLAPWRFIIFEGAARERAGAIIADVYAGHNPDATTDQLAFEGDRLPRAPLGVAGGGRAAPPIKNPGMGAAAFGRRFLHGARTRRAWARLRGELDHRVVRV